MAWTEEQKDKVVELYQAGNPTPENSVELIKTIADQIEQSANGVRMILVQKGVYVKKDQTPATGSDAKGSKTATATKRVSKEDSINALKEAIKAAGKTVDDEILDKLTGKAAIYLTTLIA